MTRFFAWFLALFSKPGALPSPLPETTEVHGYRTAADAVPETETASEKSPWVRVICPHHPTETRDRHGLAFNEHFVVRNGWQHGHASYGRCASRWGCDLVFADVDYYPRVHPEQLRHDTEFFAADGLKLWQGDLHDLGFVEPVGELQT